MNNESLADRFAEHALHQPEATALIWQGEHISYGELQKMAANAHEDLTALDLPRDRPLGIRAKKSPQAIALILACLLQKRPFLLPSVELAPETLDLLFAQADASKVLTPQDDASRGVSVIANDVEADTGSEWPPEAADEACRR
jgi:acyl-CoA synthetase (AMP-forming)/AMP-acid ligase II